MTLVLLEYATRYFPVSITRPVRSSTEFAGTVTPYSKNALSAGAVLPDGLVVVNASLTVTAVAFLLHIEIDATAKVVAGQRYTFVYVAAAKSAIPNLPVAIIISP